MSDPTDPLFEAAKHAGSGGTGALLVAAVWRWVAGKSAEEIEGKLDGLRGHLDERLDKQDEKLSAIGDSLADRRREHELLKQQVETLDGEVTNVRKRLHDLASSVTAALGDLRELRARIGLRGTTGSFPAVPSSSDSGVNEP